MREKALQRQSPRRLPSNAAMQTNRHHPTTLTIKHVEGVTQIAEELFPFRKPIQRRKFHVIHVQRIRHNQLWAPACVIIIGQIIGVGIGVIKKAPSSATMRAVLGLVRP